MPAAHKTDNKTRKRKGKDIDQIAEDLQPEKAAKLTNQEVDLDLPGDGQHYCIECNRYFTDDATLKIHVKSKVHKKRLKELKEVPYSQKEAEAAGGLGIFPHIKNRTTAAKPDEPLIG